MNDMPDIDVSEVEVVCVHEGDPAPPDDPIYALHGPDEDAG